jgi:hypothetical protein
MTIEKAPEKIWAMPSIDGKWRKGRCTNEHHIINNLTAPFVLEYTRSDIAKADWYMRAEVSRLEQVVSSLEVYIMQMEDKIDSLEKSDD